jgi:FkbM family methyltransferase
MNFLPKYLQLPFDFELRKLKNDLENELLELGNLIPAGNRAIDIGANEGLYTYKLSQICDHVESFEPQPVCADIISAYANRVSKKIIVHNCALSNFHGNSNLHIPVIHGRLRSSRATGLASLSEQEHECEKISVPVRTLDEYHFSDVTFIKIDVEGHERQVLEGAIETIIREKPILLVEIEQRHLNGSLITDIFGYVMSLGYKGSFLLNNAMQDISRFSYEEHQKPFLSNIMKGAESGLYINNFIFTPI